MRPGELIRQAREQEGLTQAQLARRLGIAQPSVARLESVGDRVTVATLRRALAALNRTLALEVAPAAQVEEHRLLEALRLPPGERLERFERAYAEARGLSPEARAALYRGALGDDDGGRTGTRPR